MKDLIKDKTFVSGFLVGMILFILLNIFFPTEKGPERSYMCDYQGFPFAFYHSGYEDMHGGIYIGEFLWLGLVGDLLFALLIGTLAAFSLKLLADRGLDLK